ncbi:MAG: hypothetical protein HZA20_01900 [Nitrospirae bacterium]|nr:hypothetical protein [Nitrospirota bacterium]
MNKKLTLLLDESVIEQAKTFAEQHKESLSGMVEKYFKYLVSGNRNKGTIAKISPEIAALTGIIHIPDAVDIKQEYRKHRAGK